MQSSGLEVEQVRVIAPPGLIERLSWTDKAPIALGFGCLLGLSAPGFDHWWLAWIGLAPLLVLIQGAKSKLEATVVGLTFGIGYYLVSLAWYLGLYPLRWLGMEDWLAFQSTVLVWAAESFHQSLLIVALAVVLSAVPMRAGFLPFFRRPFFPYLLSVPCAWVFFQWVVGTSELFLGVPVNQLAYSQCKQLELIQLTKLGGSQLLDFILVAANAGFAALIIETTGLVPKLVDRADRLSTRVGAHVDLALVALCVGAFYFWGQTELTRLSALTTLTPETLEHSLIPPVPVAVVQGNVAIEEQRLQSLSAGEIAERYISLSRGLGVPLVVFPEGILNGQQAAPGLLLSKLATMTAGEKKEVVSGSIETLDKSFVNAVRLISPEPGTDRLAVKRRLVPFGEFVPGGLLAELLPADLKRVLLGRSEGFVAARSVFLLGSIWGKIGASVCVEVIYPKLIAEEVRQGASLLVNVSNLSWFHGASLNKQVLAASILRAVENGRYLVLATNTGISAVVDPAGVVTGVSIPGHKGVLINTVQFLYKKTPFTKMWWL